MQIFVDGYNFIGRQRGLRGDIPAKRSRLIADLVRYHQIKGVPVTVVFDAGRSVYAYEHEERMGGISIIFAGREETADDVLIRLASHLGTESVVVSSDRAVQEGVRASGGRAVYSGDFETKLNAALNGANNPKLAPQDRDEEPLPVRPHFGAKKGNPFKRPRDDRDRDTLLRKL